jgi:hypothetical protein
MKLQTLFIIFILASTPAVFFCLLGLIILFQNSGIYGLLSTPFILILPVIITIYGIMVRKNKYTEEKKFDHLTKLILIQIIIDILAILLVLSVIGGIN